MLANVLDRVISFTAHDEKELVRGREEWGALAGHVHDDDPLYEERTTAFLEWYALERRGPRGHVPAQEFLAKEAKDDEERAWVRALVTSHRSLFQVERVRPGEILLEDLLSGASFLVTERRRLPGLEEGQVFEARLVADPTAPPQVIFSRAFQFHPAEAQEELRRQSNRARKHAEPRAETLFRLLRLRVKALRYRHVAADRIYAGDDAT